MESDKADDDSACSAPKRPKKAEKKMLAPVAQVALQATLGAGEILADMAIRHHGGAHSTMIKRRA